MCVEQTLHGLASRAERGILQRTRRVTRGIPGGEEQRVALTQRDVEAVR